MKIVVSDTSPVRALAHLGMESLLVDLFGQVLVPPAVAAELQSPPPTFKPIRIAALPGFAVVKPADEARIAELLRFLDRGESEAIALAVEIRADGLLIDEAAGRTEARRLGLTTVGVVGLLHRAKQRGRVDYVLPLLDRLRDEARFFVSEALREQARRLCGE